MARSLLRVFALLAALSWGTALPAAPDAGPRPLRVQVRDSAPGETGSVRRGADGSTTVSTAGDGHATAAGPADNGTTLSTGSVLRELVVLEGEPVRVDLPAVQSLQFHVPMVRPGGPPAGAPPGTPPGPAAGTPAGAAGVLYFEAVAAFSARFSISGNQAQVTLVPLRTGSVAAPWIDGAGNTGAAGTRPVVLAGRIGDWISLGDSNLPRGGRTLMPTAEPPLPAAVWVRVLPAAAAAQR